MGIEWVYWAYVGGVLILTLYGLWELKCLIDVRADAKRD